MSEEPKWRKARGDGSDRLPLSTVYEALRRDGAIERNLAITKFCVSMGADLFRHHGKPWDVVAVRIIKEP